MTCPIESTNDIVIECQNCIDQLEAEIKSDTERSIEDKETNASRNGEIAGYQWIIYKITGDINGYKPKKEEI